ncbi:MAG: trypsin-like peptidase domain-containing protein [Chitinophagaceae bacterium]|jgi:hypothetical protein|nr:trypsin-like peptidase domain-containing protein [Chitinophagaceae bacterium]
MFEKAIETALQFTRPLHTITRSYGGLIMPGSSTLFFVNNHGMAITCKHVAQLIPGAENINKTYNNFREERNKLLKDGKFKRSLQGLEIKYKYHKESSIQLKNNFINCFDKIEQITVHTHPELDLAILVFKGFNEIKYQSHAKFIKTSSHIKQGKYLCRLGFPFPEYSNFKHDQDKDDIEWTQTGQASSPAFPIDGIITRLAANAQGQPITGIEMSTPGLRGQSGGPLFDTLGNVYGMQYATRHLHLGFDIRDKEILHAGEKKKVSNFPFLHVGLCVHVDRIKEFLQLHKIDFFETED